MARILPMSDVPKINRRYKRNTKISFLHLKFVSSVGNKVGPVRLDRCVIGLVGYLSTILLKDGNGFVL
jgi:hypothetical protein